MMKTDLDFIADGSDYGLGMNSDYDYESDNLVEGILSKNTIFPRIKAALD